MDVDAALGIVGEHPQVIDAVRMVGVIVREEDAVDGRDLGVEELLANVRRRIDEHPGAIAPGDPLDEGGTASTAVLRIVRIAAAPMRAEARYTAG